MTDFATELLAITGTASDAYDIRAMVARCFFYDFDGYPVRLWAGQGVLTTSTSVGNPVVTTLGTLAANEWLGTYDAAGNNRHQAASLQDARDGASPRMKFSLPHIDLATYEALKADQALAQGRDLVIYRAIFAVGEGLRPLTPIQFAARLTMKSVEFARTMGGTPESPEVVYSASVLVASGEEGRTRVPNSTYSDTQQRERARQLGVTADSGCIYVAGNAQRTFIVGG